MIWREEKRSYFKFLSSWSSSWSWCITRRTRWTIGSDLWANHNTGRSPTLTAPWWFEISRMSPGWNAGAIESVMTIRSGKGVSDQRERAFQVMRQADMTCKSGKRRCRNERMVNRCMSGRSEPEAERDWTDFEGFAVRLRLSEPHTVFLSNSDWASRSEAFKYSLSDSPRIRPHSGSALTFGVCPGATVAVNAYSLPVSRASLEVEEKYIRPTFTGFTVSLGPFLESISNIKLLLSKGWSRPTL